MNRGRGREGERKAGGGLGGGGFGGWGGWGAEKLECLSPPYVLTQHCIWSVNF